MHFFGSVKEMHRLARLLAERALCKPCHSLEVAIKSSLGKLSLQIPFEDLFPGVLTANGFGLLQSDLAHYRALLQLPFHHRDPFDRLLIAQAQVEGLTLVTRDASLASYGVPLLW